MLFCEEKDEKSKYLKPIQYQDVKKNQFNSKNSSIC